MPCTHVQISGKVLIAGNTFGNDMSRDYLLTCWRNRGICGGTEAAVVEK